MDKLLTLHINCTSSYEVVTDAVTVRQILFDGIAEGDGFRGVILPGGVDTQTIYPDGSGKLSARYIVEGLDAQGNACKLYIENSAEMGNEYTEPVIITDSKCLMYMQNKKLQGRLVHRDEEFLIEIWG